MGDMQGGHMQGKVVAVTGAARGLGASLARQLTERGARVALLGLEPGELDAVSSRCPGLALVGGRRHECGGSRQRRAGVAGTLRPARRARHERRGRERGTVPARRPRRVRPHHRDQPARQHPHPARVPAGPHRQQGLRAADRLAGGAGPRADAVRLLRQQVRGRGLRRDGAHRTRLARGRRRRRLPVVGRHRSGTRRRRAARHRQGALGTARRARQDLPRRTFRRGAVSTGSSGGPLTSTASAGCARSGPSAA